MSLSISFKHSASAEWLILCVCLLFMSSLLTYLSSVLNVKMFYLFLAECLGIFHFLANLNWTGSKV